MGQTTDLCEYVRTSETIFDNSGWFERTKSLTLEPYPEKLKEEILRVNWQALSHPSSSIRHDLEVAYARGDFVSWHFLIVSFMAAYFDIVFAHNKLFHPGMKHVPKEARRRCNQLPANFDNITLLGGAPLRRESLQLADSLLTGLSDIVGFE